MTRDDPQRKRACSTCPFRRDGDRSICFTPSVLIETAVQNLAEGYVHMCHSDASKFCAGYLRFAENTLPHGVQSLALGAIGVRLGVIDLNAIPQTNVFESVDEMLEDHAARLKKATRIETTKGKKR